MLLEPLPWTDVEGDRIRYVQAEMAVWYPIVLLAAVGLWAGVKRRVCELVFPVVAGGGILLTYALAEGNLGTAYRHRSEFFYAMILLAGLGAYHLHGWWRSRRGLPAAVA